MLISIGSPSLNVFIHGLRFRLAYPDEVSAYALHTLTNGFSFDDSEVSHAASVLDMWTTADLHRVIANFVDVDHVAIALTEECQRSLIERLLQGHHLHPDGKVTLNLLVHDLLYLADLLKAQLPGMREVKAQSLRRNVASHLMHVWTEHITQRLLEQMRRSM